MVVLRVTVKLSGWASARPRIMTMMAVMPMAIFLSMGSPALMVFIGPAVAEDASLA
ncbi:hypothetical protein D3C86_2031910 [compost metagenome]